MPGAIGWSAEVLSPRGGIRVRQQFQMLGVYCAGFLCLVLAVLKRRPGAVVVVACPVTFMGGVGPQCSVHHGRVCLALFTADGAADEVTIRQDDGPYGYQLAAMLCFLIFADNLLRRIDGHEEMMWFGVSTGKWELVARNSS